MLRFSLSWEPTRIRNMHTDIKTPADVECKISVILSVVQKSNSSAGKKGIAASETPQLEYINSPNDGSFLLRSPQWCHVLQSCTCTQFNPVTYKHRQAIADELTHNSRGAPMRKCFIVPLLIYYQYLKQMSVFRWSCIFHYGDAHLYSFFLTMFTYDGHCLPWDIEVLCKSEIFYSPPDILFIHKTNLGVRPSYLKTCICQNKTKEKLEVTT